MNNHQQDEETMPNQQKMQSPEPKENDIRIECYDKSLNMDKIIIFCSDMPFVVQISIIS